MSLYNVLIHVIIQCTCTCTCICNINTLRSRGSLGDFWSPIFGLGLLKSQPLVSPI